MDIENKPQNFFDKFNVDSDSEDSEDDGMSDFIIDDIEIEEYYNDDDYELSTDNESDMDTDYESYTMIEEE